MKPKRNSEDQIQEIVSNFESQISQMKERYDEDKKNL